MRDFGTHDFAKRMFMLDEGKRRLPYVDSTGHITIGIGRNLTDVGLSEDEINHLFVNDIYRAQLIRESIYNGEKLGTYRYLALDNMAFNLGEEGLRSFKKMWRAIQERDFEKAANEILDSVYAEQVGDRAHRVAYMMEHDKPHPYYIKHGVNHD